MVKLNKLALSLLFIIVCQVYSYAQKNKELSFEYEKNQIIVKATVNGKDGYYFLLDTGVDPSVIGHQTAKELKLPIEAEGGNASGRGDNKVQVFPTKMKISLNEGYAEEIEALTLDMKALSKKLGRKIHGILGYSFLKNKRFIIDYENGKIIFCDNKESFQDQFSDKALSTAFFYDGEDRIPLVSLFKINDKPFIASFDTGSSLNIQVYLHRLKDLGLESIDLDNSKESSIYGAQGKKKTFETTLESILVSERYQFMNERLTISEIKNTDQKRMGNIGNAFLENFKIGFDYQNQTVLLEKSGVNGINSLFDQIASFDKVRDFTITHTSDEAYFTVQSPLEEVSLISLARKKNNKWLKPEIASFSGKYKDLEPMLSPDNMRLYFVSNRPVHKDSTATKDFDIWYVERTTIKSPWSQPKNLGTPVNTSNDEFYPSIAKNGNLYFTSVRDYGKGEDDIYFSKWSGNSYENPVPLSENINTQGYEFNSYIAADESYLIFSGYNRQDGLGSGDMYISFKDENGSWSKAKNLGEEINSKYMDYCPYVDEKTNTLYFTSRRSAIKPMEFQSIKDLNGVLNQYENGKSRIYTKSFNPKRDIADSVGFNYLNVQNNNVNMSHKLKSKLKVENKFDFVGQYNFKESHDNTTFNISTATFKNDERLIFIHAEERSDGGVIDYPNLKLDTINGYPCYVRIGCHNLFEESDQDIKANKFLYFLKNKGIGFNKGLYLVQFIILNEAKNAEVVLSNAMFMTKCPPILNEFKESLLIEDSKRYFKDFKVIDQ